jgi:hypothetical protein
MDIVIPEASLHAQASIIYAYPIPARHLDHPLAMEDIQIHLTPGGAKGARCLYPVELPDSSFDRTQVFSKGPYGTDMETFPTGDACIGIDRLNMGLKPPVDHIEDMRAGNLYAGLDAAHTHHTTIHPLPDQRCPKGNSRSFHPFQNEILPVDPVLVGQVLKLALAPGVANRTIQGMLNEKEFDRISPHLLHPSCTGVNDHPFGYRSGTCGHGIFHIVDFNDADAT